MEEHPHSTVPKSATVNAAPIPELNGSRALPELPTPVYAPIDSPGEFSEQDAQQVAVRALKAKYESSLGILLAVMGFSVLNALLILVGSPITMAFGLSITDLIAVGAKQGPFWVLVFALIPLGFYYLLTRLSKKHFAWLVVLCVFYAIDALMAVKFERWMGTAVHFYVFYRLWQGVSALFAARKLERMPASFAS